MMRAVAQFGVLLIALAVTVHGRRSKNCPEGFVRTRSGWGQWCCRGHCPYGHEWASFEQFCSLVPSRHWPPLCPNTEIATGKEYDLYSWGSNSQGQCGSLRKGEKYARNIHAPVKVATLVGANALDVALGYQHGIAITFSYSVYVWGGNTKGQLGVGGVTSQATPVRINELQGLKVRAVDAGGYHTAAVSKQGLMFTWGNNDYGQLGRPYTIADYAMPVSDLRFRNVVKISLGLIHTAALTDNGDLYTWGGGEQFQLGHGVPRGEEKPRIVRELQGVRLNEVKCGCEHTIALASNMTVYTWGLNKYGELGHGDVSYRRYPTIVKGLELQDIATVAAGCHHSVALTRGGSIFIWGWNAMGQLGLGDTDNRLTPGWIHGDYFGVRMKVMKVDAGYAHTVIMTHKGNIWTWGFGEYGQLGLGDDRNRTTPFQVMEFQDSSFKIAAGGYTTAAIASEIVDPEELDPVNDLPDLGQGNMPGSEVSLKMEDHDAGLGAPYSENIRVHIIAPATEKSSAAASLHAVNNLQREAVVMDDESQRDTRREEAMAQIPPEMMAGIDDIPVPKDAQRRLDPEPREYGDCPKGTETEECERLQEERDFSNPDGEYEAQVKKWYDPTGDGAVLDDIEASGRVVGKVDRTIVDDQTAPKDGTYYETDYEDNRRNYRKRRMRQQNLALPPSAAKEGDGYAMYDKEDAAEQQVEEGAQSGRLLRGQNDGNRVRATTMPPAEASTAEQRRPPKQQLVGARQDGSGDDDAEMYDDDQASNNADGSETGEAKDVPGEPAANLDGSGGLDAEPDAEGDDTLVSPGDVINAGADATDATVDAMDDAVATSSSGDFANGTGVFEPEMKVTSSISPDGHATVVGAEVAPPPPEDGTDADLPPLDERNQIPMQRQSLRHRNTLRARFKANRPTKVKAHEYDQKRSTSNSTFYEHRLTKAQKNDFAHRRSLLLMNKAEEIVHDMEPLPEGRPPPKPSPPPGPIADDDAPFDSGLSMESPEVGRWRSRTKKVQMRGETEEEFFQ